MEPRQLLHSLELMSQKFIHSTRSTTFYGLRHRSSTQSIRGSGFYSHRVGWHPKYAVLCLIDEATWRFIDGSIIHDFGASVGIWHPNGACFIHSTSNHTAYWYNFQSASHSKKTDFFVGPSSCNPNHTLVLGKQLNGEDPGLLTVWSPELGLSTLLKYSHTTYTDKYRWSHDGRFIAAVGRDNNESWVGVWEYTGKLINKIILPDSVVLIDSLLDSSIGWSADNSILVVHGHRNIVWWNTDKDDCQVIPLEIEEMSGAFCGLQWHPIYPYLAVNVGTKIVLFSQDGDRINILDNPDGSIISTLSWHPSYPLILMGSWNCNITLWTLEGQLFDSHNIVTDTPIYPREPLQVPYYSGFHPDGSWLAVTTRSYFIHIYQLNIKHL